MGAGRNRTGRTSMISAGFGGIREIITKIVKLGQSGAKRALRELEDVFIAAKLIRVNDERPKQNIHGHLTVKVDFSRHIAVMAEGLSKKVHDVLKDIKVTINRIR